MRSAFLFDIFVSMKKILTILTFLFFAFAALGQETVLSTWPYLYQDFTKGAVYMSDGKKYEKDMNVHVAKSRLHFLDGDQIKEIRSSDIVLVELNGDQFTVVGDNVVKVIGDLESGYIGVLTVIDYLRINEVDGPYGSKMDGSTAIRGTAFDVNGIYNDYKELLNSRSYGNDLALKTDYYLVVAGRVYTASKKGVENGLDAEGKAAFKTFLKQNKIRWKDPESLMEVVEFLKFL